MNDQDRITQLEAACAAMRECLETLLRDKFGGFWKPIQQALSTDAGKSLLDRLQAVEKEHTALRLAAEELVTYVRHGDQEDIGEAMGKIESILQPAKEQSENT